MLRAAASTAVVLALALFWVWPVPAEETRRLEARLSAAKGQQRLGILVQLTDRLDVVEPDRAVALAEEALGLLLSFPDPALENQLWASLAQARFRLHDSQTALQYVGRAERLARAREDPRQLARALDLIGDIYRSLGDGRRSLESTREAIDLYLQLGDRSRLAMLLHDAGIAYRQRGDFSEAVRFYLWSCQVKRDLGERASLARTLNNLGVVYRRLGQFSAAEEVYREALAIQEQEGNRQQVARLLNNLGVVYKMKDDLEPAVDQYSRSLVLKEQLGDLAGSAVSHTNLGLAFEGLGDLQRAESHYRRALEIREQTGGGRSPGVLNRLAFLHRSRGDLQPALELVEEARTLAETRSSPRDLRSSYRELSEIHAAAGRYRQATLVFEEYQRIDDEILQQRKREAMAFTRLRFELDRKEEEAALLAQRQALGRVELERQETTRRTLITALVLLLLSGFLLASRHRFIARSAHTIESRNESLASNLAELGESEQRYRSLFDEPSLAKLIWDPSAKRVADANSTAADLLETSRKELLGATGAAERPDWLRSFLERLRPEKEDDAARWLGELPVDGAQERYLEAWATRLSLGGRTLALITFRDVTEQRKLEEERLRREEHERHLADLAARKAEVEARNTEMERFVYIVSHDLKAPLVTIRGFVGLLQKDSRAGDLERVRHDIERIERATAKMASFLDDLLELSRSGRVIRDPEEVSTLEVVYEARNLVLGDGPERPGAQVQIAEDLPPVYGDRSRLLEVFQNLLDNAMRFGRAGVSPEIEVGWRKESEPVFFVRDNGVGVEPGDEERIFELFDRGSRRELQREVEGTGVGLAIVKRIVEVHGGRIWVESEGEADGASFCLTLPRGSSPGATEAVAAPAEPGAGS